MGRRRICQRILGHLLRASEDFDGERMELRCGLDRRASPQANLLKWINKQLYQKKIYYDKIGHYSGVANFEPADERKKISRAKTNTPVEPDVDRERVQNCRKRKEFLTNRTT